MMGEIFSAGKLLLTSEYVVLDGALALAVPTRLGQVLFYDTLPSEAPVIKWKAYHQEKLWLEAEIDPNTWSIIRSNNLEAAKFICKVLRGVDHFSKGIFKDSQTYYFKTILEFPSDFGLGSSSTLMNCLGQWANIDPFLLNEYSLGGSGYDIAVAKENNALLYQINGGEREWKSVSFNPDFHRELILIHLGKKQNSRDGILHYREQTVKKEWISEFSRLTMDVLNAKDLSEFEALMSLHEVRISEIIGLPTIKEQLFSDAPVFIKSLGAWGGDFILSRRFPSYNAYFSERGFSTIFDYSELVRL